VLGEAVAYAGPHGAAVAGIEDPSGTPQARAIWDDVDDEVRTWINNYRTQLTTTISAELKAAGAEATAHEKEAFERRIREVSALQRDQPASRRSSERSKSSARQPLQYSLLEDANALAEQKAARLAGRTETPPRPVRRFAGTATVQERDRVLRHVLPHRFSLRSTAQVFPVTVEIRLPGVQA
jgi:hypothetical protein